MVQNVNVYWATCILYATFNKYSPLGSIYVVDMMINILIPTNHSITQLQIQVKIPNKIYDKYVARASFSITECEFL